MSADAAVAANDDVVVGPAAPPPGTAEAVLLGVAAGTWDALKDAPAMLARFLLPRLPIMAVSSLGVWVVHTFALVYLNEGYNAGGTFSPFLYTSGNFFSSILLYGFSSALLWSLLFSAVRMGPLGALTHFVTRPQQLYRQVMAGGPRGSGAAIIGIGCTLLAATVLGLNVPATGVASLSLLFLGPSRPGYLLAAFLTAAWANASRQIVRQGRPDIPAGLGLFQQAIHGLAPGFFVCFLLGLPPYLIGLLPWPALVNALSVLYFLFRLGFGAAVLGIGIWLLWRHSAGDRGTVASVLLLGGLSALLYTLLAFLYPGTAAADDGGASEIPAGQRWIESEGAIWCIVHGAPPAAATGGGVATPPMGDPPAEKRYGLVTRLEPARLEVNGTSAAVFSAYFTTDDPDCDAAALTEAIAIEVGGDADLLTGGEPVAGEGGKTLRLGTVRETSREAGHYAATITASVNGPPGLFSKTRELKLEVTAGEYQLVFF